MIRISAFFLLAALGIGLLTNQATAASIIGAGTAIPNDEVDSGGGRINVDQGNPVTLPAGIYAASLFNYDAGVAGDVTPFLAFRPNAGDSNTYTTLAVGSVKNITAGVDQSVAFGGSSTFTLLAPTQVFAGIASSTQNPIFLDNGTGPNTDHEGGGQAATSYLVTLPGQLVPPDGSFSNPELGRSYAFSVTVVPEPSSLVLAAIGLVGAGLLARRRRN